MNEEEVVDVTESIVNVQVKGFVITTKDSTGSDVSFKFEDSHYAEQVLRGLVHSGHVVTISEELIIAKRFKSEHVKVPRGLDPMTTACGPMGYRG